MINLPIDYSQIKLQENIPLSDEDINHIDKQRKDFFNTDTAGVLIFCTILIMAIAYYFIQNELNFQFYHYVLFILSGFVFFGFCYLMVWVTFIYFKKNWDKDIINGKNKLSSIIISRHKTEHDEYIMTFAGRHKNEKIRIPVKKEYYCNYPKGTKVLVTYLKYSKEVLEITELQ